MNKATSISYPKGLICKIEPKGEQSKSDSEKSNEVTPKGIKKEKERLLEGLQEIERVKNRAWSDSMEVMQIEAIEEIEIFLLEVEEIFGAL